MTPACVEHVWVLRGLVADEQGQLLQRFECERCTQVLVIGDDEPSPYDPDWPS